MTTQDYGRVLAHRTRTEIVKRIEDEPCSPAKLASDLGVPVTQMAYHVRALVKMGALRPAGTRPRRGAIEHFYRVSPGVRPTLIALLAAVEAREEGPRRKAA